MPIHINDLTPEIFVNILEHAALLNEREGISFGYGLSELHIPHGRTVPDVEKYVRGPISKEQLRWDSVYRIRQVCRLWHDWAVGYAFHDMFVELWRGSQRWCDLTHRRDKFWFYELNVPRGEKVRQDPHASLRNTRRLLEACPVAASNVRRLWFHGLYVPETDLDIVSTARSCVNLSSASLPWTILRHASAEDLAAILAVNRDLPLQSLEFQAVTLSTSELEARSRATISNPLLSPIVDFSHLRRLKLIGNTDFMPITDADLKAIARTATNLEEFHMTCISTITIDGVMAIVRASRNTLRVLEHSPRSNDGFWHPHPGYLQDGAHICDILTSCPRLQDLSISIPTMCASLFSNHSVRWRGECQVRALGLCGHDDYQASGSDCGNSHAAHLALRKVLSAARGLMRVRANGTIPDELNLEIFFADMIFDPVVHAVHGDFAMAEMISGGTWPARKKPSRKGPYGSTGLYGKDFSESARNRVEGIEEAEDRAFTKITEDEVWAGLGRGLLRLN